MADKVLDQTDSGLLERSRSSPGLMLALLGGEAMRRLRDAHTAHDLTPRQFELLGHLHDQGPTAQSDLGQTMRTAASILVTQLNPLELDGLIVRTRDPADRRRHIVGLTPRGLERLRRAADAQQDVEDDLFSALDPQQRQQLQRILAVVRDDLTAGHDHCATPASLDAPLGGR